MKNSNFQIFPENNNNNDAIDKLYDDVFGKDRKKRSVYYLRTGKKVSDLCFVIKKDENEIFALSLVKKITIQNLDFKR